jgi:hypothetical protein
MHPPCELSSRVCCRIVLQIPDKGIAAEGVRQGQPSPEVFSTLRSRRRSARTNPSRCLGAMASFSAHRNFHQAPPSCSIDLAHRRFQTILSTVRAPLIDKVQQRGQLQGPQASLNRCAGPSAASSVFFAAAKCGHQALFNYCRSSLSGCC